MAYKLAIAAVLVTSVGFTLNDEGTIRTFKFKLTFDRLTEDEWNRRIKNDNGITDNASVKKALTDITKGWQGQTLVVDENGEPAPFCQEALEVMYDTPGVADAALAVYLKEVGAKVKN